MRVSQRRPPSPSGLTPAIGRFFAISAPVSTAGTYVAPDLPDDLPRVRAREAIARGVEAMPLSMYARVATGANGLLLGFAPIRPEDAADGMRRLAASIDAARSAHRRRAPVAVRLVRA